MRWILGLLAIAAVCLGGSTARCEDQPFLLLDTGGHQARIIYFSVLGLFEFVVANVC